MRSVKLSHGPECSAPNGLPEGVILETVMGPAGSTEAGRLAHHAMSQAHREVEKPTGGVERRVHLADAPYTVTLTPRELATNPGSVSGTTQRQPQVTEPCLVEPSVLLEAPEGRPTLRVAYAFSGKKRKASVAEYHLRFCEVSRLGLVVWEVYILTDSVAADFKNDETQDNCIGMIEERRLNALFVFPHCCTWGRAVFSNMHGAQAMSLGDAAVGLPLGAGCAGGPRVR